jgi:hypothetical protein
MFYFKEGNFLSQIPYSLKKKLPDFDFLCLQKKEGIAPAFSVFIFKFLKSRQKWRLMTRGFS